MVNYTLASGRTHLVGGGQQRFRDGEAERLGSLEVDDEIDFCDLLHREVGGFVALENAPSIDASLAVPIADAAAIAYQAAGHSVLTIWEHRGQRMADRQRRDLFRVSVEEGTGANQDRANALLRKSCEGQFEIAIGGGIHDNELRAQRARRRL